MTGEYRNVSRETRARLEARAQWDAGFTPIPDEELPLSGNARLFAAISALAIGLFSIWLAIQLAGRG